MEPRQEFEPVAAAARVDGPRIDPPFIDLGRALELLAAAVQQRGERFVFVAGRHQSCLYASDGGPQCLVGRCLSLAGVDEDDLDALGGHGVRELYDRGGLPVRLTLGALVVFDAAQRGQDRGYAWGEALEYAVGVAERFLDLIRARSCESAPEAGWVLRVEPLPAKIAQVANAAAAHETSRRRRP